MSHQSPDSQLKPPQRYFEQRESSPSETTLVNAMETDADSTQNRRSFEMDFIPFPSPEATRYFEQREPSPSEITLINAMGIDADSTQDTRSPELDFIHFPTSLEAAEANLNQAEFDLLESLGAHANSPPYAIIDPRVLDIHDTDLASSLFPLPSPGQMVRRRHRPESQPRPILPFLSDQQLATETEVEMFLHDNLSMSTVDFGSANHDEDDMINLDIPGNSSLIRRRRRDPSIIQRVGSTITSLPFRALQALGMMRRERRRSASPVRNEGPVLYRDRRG